MTANTGYCLSFQEHPCMLTVTWRPEVSWREAVCLSRLQSVLSSSSILSSFFFLRQFRRHCFFYLVIVKVLFVISFFADVDECTASTPVCGLQFNCNNTLGSYSCEYNHSCCQGMKSIHQLFILMINLFPRDLEKPWERDWFVMTPLNPLEARWNDKCRESLSKCFSRNRTQNNFRSIPNKNIHLSYDVRRPFKSKIDDVNANDIMILITRSHAWHFVKCEPLCRTNGFT